MNISELKSAVLSGGFDRDFLTLYGETENSRARYTEALDEFDKLFPNSKNVRIFSAPGRTEIGGNHTDHQHGCVLAGSVNLDVIAIVAPNGKNTITVKSKGYNADVVPICDFAPDKNEYGKSAAIIKGVLKAFADKGVKIEGFDAYTTSNVLKGSGLSSSAAFEVLIGNIVNRMFSGNATDIEIAKIGQFAEREFFGKPCGLLDQMASSLGGFTYADFRDPQNPVTESFELDIKKQGYTLCVVDTGGSHSDLTNDYADITVECKAVSRYLGVEFLRDADTDRFYGEIAKIRKACGDRAVLRAFHFFNENERVLKQRKALSDGEFEQFLQLVKQSGKSSAEYLQNLYSTSKVDSQGLMLGLALTEKFLGNKGACRVHGGGFAGTIQCYVPTEMLQSYKEMIENCFGKDSCTVLFVRPVGGYELTVK